MAKRSLTLKVKLTRSPAASQPAPPVDGVELFMVQRRTVRIVPPLRQPPPIGGLMTPPWAFPDTFPFPMTGKWEPVCEWPDTHKQAGFTDTLATAQRLRDCAKAHKPIFGEHEFRIIKFKLPYEVVE